MFKNSKMIVLFSLFTHICFLVAFVVFNNLTTWVIFLPIYLITLLVFFITPKKYSYLLLVITVITYTSFQFYIILYNKAKISVQYENVIFNIFILFSAIGLWFCIYYLKSLYENYNLLSEELIRNKKYMKSTQVLTINEFKYRLKTLIMSISRRNENAFIIAVKINENVEQFKINALTDKLASSWLNSTRDNYDIVGIINKNTIYIALQNTDNEGLEVVMNRFYSKFECDNLDSEILHSFKVYFIDILAYINKKSKNESNIYDISSIKLFEDELPKEMVKYDK